MSKKRMHSMWLLETSFNIVRSKQLRERSCDPIEVGSRVRVHVAARPEVFRTIV